MRRLRHSLRSLRFALSTAPLVIAGCASPPALVEPPVDARGAATPLVFGDVVQGELDCNAGRCRRWYRFALGAPGELRVDVEAPVGEGVPDFDVRLEDAAGDMGIRDGRQHAHATATGRTAKGVDLEDPLQEVGPDGAARQGVQRIDAD